MTWDLAKDPEKISRLATVLYNLLESIRVAAVLTGPYMPDTATKILDQIGTQYRDYDSIQTFGMLEEDINVTSEPEILFQRLNEEEINEKVQVIQANIAAQAKKDAKKAAEITTEDFEKVDLRVGVVTSCEKHPDADKLLILQVDLGDEHRQIVSGIADSYTPGQMIGKHVVVISNLKEAKIRGYDSKGMLLAGKEGDQLAIVEVNGLKPGTKIY